MKSRLFWHWRIVLLLLLLGLGCFYIIQTGKKPAVWYETDARSKLPENEGSGVVNAFDGHISSDRPLPVVEMVILRKEEVNNAVFRLSGISLPSSSHGFGMLTFKIPRDDLKEFLTKFQAGLDLKNTGKWIGHPEMSIADYDHTIAIDGVSLAKGHLKYYLRPRPTDAYPEEEGFTLKFCVENGVVCYSHVNLEE